MNLVWPESQLVRVVVTRCDDPGEDVSEFGIIIDEAQQRFAPRPCLADTQDVLGRGVQVRDEQVLIEEDYARAEAFEYISCVEPGSPAVVGALPRSGGAVA